MFKRIMLGFVLLCSVLIITPAAYAYWVNQLESEWTIPVTHQVTVTVTASEPDMIVPMNEQSVNSGDADLVNNYSEGLTIDGPKINNFDTDSSINSQSTDTGESEIRNLDSNNSDNGSESVDSGSDSDSSSSDSSNESDGGSDPS